MQKQTFFLFKISGVVQGVGFRPFFYREAHKKGLKGYIKNTGDGVEILADDKIKVLKILENIPILAKITSISNRQLTINNEYDDFVIEFSENTMGMLEAQIPPDICTCEECVGEILDPKNRRFEYFFTSCTNCGPRFSIAKNLPFDRKTTALESFLCCPECLAEYKNPENRRFHAQTIACQKCGPKLEFYENRKKYPKNPLKYTVELLQKNEIISVKGVGGFFLVCIANEVNTQKLRILLNRPKKPFSVMMQNLEIAQKFCEISEKEQEVLLSNARPIVLCRKKNDDFKFLSANDRLGILLPYSGIHHLIFQKIKKPLIITSANFPDIPIPIRKEEQDWKYILDYNREIINFSDDSVLKVIENSPILIRRSRGFVPQSIDIPSNFRNFKDDILALGSDLKNAFAIKKGNSIILSPYLGDMEKLENFKNLKQTLESFLKLTGAVPKIVLCDLNPTFVTSKLAQKYAVEKNLTFRAVQHHLAHVFSAALEHNLSEFIGISGDGVGWGSDEKVWGGEVFAINNNLNFIERVGYLENQALVGGDIANREPVRFLVGILSRFLEFEAISEVLPNFRSADLKVFYAQKFQNFNCIESSSCGRILDAAAILLGLGEKNFYEGYLAEMLESGSKGVSNVVAQQESLFIEPILDFENEKWILKTTPIFEFLVKNRNKISSTKLAEFVAMYLAKGFLEITQKISPNLPLVFSGGCVYSSIITKFLLSKNVKINKNVPAGDGGIAVGQIAFQLAVNSK